MIPSRLLAALALVASLPLAACAAATDEDISATDNQLEGTDPDGSDDYRAKRPRVYQAGYKVAQAAFDAGIPCGSKLVLAVAVAKAESGWDSNAAGINNNGSIDRGLWQINSIHSQYTRAQMYTVAGNAKAMYAISKKGTSFSPWYAYKSGAYSQYMDEAQDAVDEICGK